MTASIYRLEGVRRLYQGRPVVDIAQLDVEPGEILAIVGPSGAGKSTLLRLLNFLEFPDSGTLHYRGHSVTHESVTLALRREVTTVFQRPALLSMSVMENVTYGLHLRGERGGRARVETVLERMGLAALSKAPARTLSGGEAQRVALARALVIRPAVMLLDEPTANLDPYNVGLIESVVAGMNQEEGTTMVLVTHNIFQARRLARRVVFLLNGQVVEVAPSRAFFEMPVDPRTAAFVRGEMVC